MSITGRAGSVLCVSLLLSACAGTPWSTRAPAVSDALSAKAASYAAAMIGRPYRYGGSSPQGFDCSGLVQYSYAKVGVEVPRDTQALSRLAAAVDANELRRGDLLFFDEEGKKRSHVGIYLGGRRFAHAPSAGGKVKTDTLDAAYWRTHFVEARRL